MTQIRPILVVDDEPNIRLTFRTALESAGWPVAEAADGQSALDALRQSSYSLVLLDLRMPGLDGMETLRRMRDEQIGVPVVMITAHGSIPDAVEAMRLGAIDFVSKPVTPEALRRAVAEILERHEDGATSKGGVRAVLTRAKREINERNFEVASQLIAGIKGLDEMGLAEAHYLRGLLLEMRGKVIEAEAAYRAAREADPEYEPVRTHLEQRAHDHAI
jgi:DNA-binding NtrC family response regulator